MLNFPLVDILFAWEISCLSKAFYLCLGKVTTTWEFPFHPLVVRNPYGMHTICTCQKLISRRIYRSLGIFVHFRASKFILAFFFRYGWPKIAPGHFYLLWVTKITLQMFFLCFWRSNPPCSYFFNYFDSFDWAFIRLTRPSKNLTRPSKNTTRQQLGRLDLWVVGGLLFGQLDYWWAYCKDYNQLNKIKIEIRILFRCRIHVGETDMP